MIVKEKIESRKWGNCLKLVNDYTELIVSLDFGPRILSYRLHGKENVFFEDPERMIFADDKEIGDYYQNNTVWYNYGGHRLWINPEKMPETYHPDTEPVDYKETEQGAVFIQKEQVPNHLGLEIEIILEEDSSKIKVIHRVTNTGDVVKRFAIWCISPMAPGGLELIPMGTLEDGALPNRVLSTWPYTDLTDSRLYIGKEFITLKQEPGNTYNPVNLGYNNLLGTVGYLNSGTLFINRFHVNPNGIYSDGGAACETFSNEFFLEVESLGELKDVAAGETVEHTEEWELFGTEEKLQPRDEESLRIFFRKHW